MKTSIRTLLKGLGLKVGLLSLTCFTQIFASYGQVDLRNYELTFSDEFEGNSLDVAKWNAQDFIGENTRNNELQGYQAANCLVSGGQLHIKAEIRQNSYGGTTKNYASGMIQTHNQFNGTNKKFAQKYGYFESILKVPKGQGLWPAFWLMPTRNTWPPEIDIIETLGHQPNTAYMSFHYGQWPDSYLSNTTEYTGTDFTAGFHKFAVDWTPSYIRWYIDDVLRKEWTTEVPQEEMFIIFNLAVGGNWPGSPDSSTPFPSYLDVDYVRCYQKRVVLNPSFEANGATQTPSSWNEWKNVAASYVEAGGLYGSYRLTHWSSSSYEVSTSQTVTGLANGTYTLSAWAKRSGGQSACLLIAKNFGGTAKQISVPSSTWTKISITEITVTNGQCQIDLYSKASANQWANFEEITLTRTSAGARTTEFINEAKETSDLQVYPTPVQDEFTVVFNSPSDQTIKLSIRDMSSKTIHQIDKDVKVGLNHIMMRAGKMQDGIYFLMIQQRGKYLAKKIIVSKK